MKNIEAIKYLDTLKMGDCLTVNIPIFRNETAQVTAMYIGRRKDIYGTIRNNSVIARV